MNLQLNNLFPPITQNVPGGTDAVVYKPPPCSCKHCGYGLDSNNQENVFESGFSDGRKSWVCKSCGCVYSAPKHSHHIQVPAEFEVAVRFVACSSDDEREREDKIITVLFENALKAEKEKHTNYLKINLTK